jgi:hypothetical protein
MKANIEHLTIVRENARYFMQYELSQRVYADNKFLGWIIQLGNNDFCGWFVETDLPDKFLEQRGVETEGSTIRGTREQVLTEFLN